MIRILGIDPGLSGGIAEIKIDNNATIVHVHDTPVVGVVRGKSHKRDYVLSSMREYLAPGSTAYPTHAFVEAVHAMPGQGATSMFTFGRGLGLWEGLLSGLCIPYTMVTPQRWKKTMMEGMNSDKSASIIRAQQLFPELAPDIHLKKHEGRAEALLIAVYGKRMLGV